MAGVGLPEILRAKEESIERGYDRKDTSVILIWLDGGPSHIDTYDMKPEAPSEYAGVWRPIRTNIPGIDITEFFPRQAQVADKFSIIRSLHHDSGDHHTGCHWMLTGRGGVSGGNKAGKYPFIGAIAAKVLGSRKPEMPANVVVPIAENVGERPGYFAGNYLGIQYNPFETVADANSPDFKVPDFSLSPGLTLNRLEDRRSLTRRFDQLRKDADNTGIIEAMDRFDRQAFGFVTGAQARNAFHLGGEDPRLRDRYGRNSWGQRTLLARRLVEAGATFVTCHFGGWDHHWAIQSGYENYLPKVDAAVSALFEDLSVRGLYDKTLVVLCGEFGRTPRLNNGTNDNLSDGTPGRDHWGNAFFCLMGGGGIQGGQVVGSTNARGEVPQDRPLRPGDIHHMIYHALGVDPSIHFLNHVGQPIPAIDHGAVIEELI